MTINFQDPSFVFSLIAILGTAFTYFKHDRKIKAQEKLINEYHIKKIEEEKIQETKAIVRATLITGSKGHRILRVYNKGKAVALNIRLIINDEPNYLYATNPFPFQLLNENENVDLKMAIHKETPDSISFNILWDDEFGVDNVHSQTVQLR